MISTRQIHWIAGLLEGEGSFTKTTPSSQSQGFSSIRIGLSMTDRDVVLKIANLLGFGSTHTTQPYKSVSGHQGHLKQYRWECSGRYAAALMMTILPLMGERRATKIKELLSYWKASKPSKRYSRPRKTFVFA